MASTRRIALDKARFAHLDLTVPPAASETEIHQMVADKLRPHVSEAEDRPIALRITLRGPTKLHDSLAGDPERLEAELQATAHRVHEEVWLEKVRVQTNRPARVAGATTGRLDPAALLAELDRDADLRARAADIIAEIRAKLPGGMAPTDEGELGDDLDQLLIEAEATVMARLSGRAC